MPVYRKEYQREYYQKNKEKRNKKHKEYYEKNKETIMKYNENYYIENPHIKTISNWENNFGIKLRPNEDWLSVYLFYITCQECENCNVKLTDGEINPTHRTLDHDHSTKFIRNILCHSCNVKRK